MRANFWYGSLLSLVALGLTACGGDDDGGGSGGAPGGGGSAATGGGGTGGGSGGTGGGSGGSAGTGGSTGGSAGTDGGATITVSGTVTEFQVGAGAPKGLADVQICPPTPTPPCVKTDANGAYSMTLPANTEGVALLTKTGYANVAVVGTTGSTDLKMDAAMPTTALAQTFATAAGFAWPLAGKSIIGFGAQEQVASDAGADAGMSWVGAAGATVAIAPVQGKGPAYLGANSLPDTAATSTSSNGAGFFGDLPAGEYQLKITAPSGKTCQRGEMQGWAGPSADSIKVPAIADYVITAVRFTCK